ncbi:hypothetical protein ACFYRN_35085 [Streptomyces sp. NPDC005227]|uniref:hypothetical protein n=1 Tax=unclassified Streptomyces TaxID=2593676 RepID=UPI00369847A0
MNVALVALSQERYLDQVLLPQVDLIAMRHGNVLERGDVDEASGYQQIGFDWA